MEGLPAYIGIVFLACTITTYGFVYFAVKFATGKNNKALPLVINIILAAWIGMLAYLASCGFFMDFEFRPPKLMLFVFGFFLSGFSLFFFPQVRKFFHRIPITTITYLHLIRVPVEMVLWWLFLQGVVPEAMTFEGMNYDIISGITAPFAALFLVGNKIKHKIGAIIWNLLALVLLFNVVIRAILATPYFYNPEMFEQPNMAIFYVPYIWLPGFIVPIVFFAHLISLYKLVSNKQEE